MNGEGEGVNTGLLGIVAEFKLRTVAVGTFCGEVCLGGNSLCKVHFACALIHNGSIGAACFDNGGCGAHEDAIDHCLTLPGAETGEVVLNILSYDCHTACNMGSCHGGAVPCLVESTGDAGIGCGVDLAAGGGDLGLDAEGGSYTAAGEVGRHVAADRIGNAHFAADKCVLIGCCRKSCTCFFADEDMGDMAAFVSNHVNCVVLVVVNNTGNRTGSFCVCSLVGEVDFAALYESDLALYVDLCEIFNGAEAGNHNVFNGLSAESLTHLNGVVCVFGVAVVNAFNADVVTLGLAVLYGSNGETCGPGGGGTYNTVIGVGNEVVAVHAPGAGGDVAAAPCVVHGSIVVVAGCHCKVNAESGYALENFCIGSVIVAFLTAGRTEGQVCGINAENRAVFNCKDDGGPACAAGG